MKNIAFTILAGAFILSACQPEYTEGEGGMEYRFVKRGGGKLVQYGQWIEMDLWQYFNDSLLRDSRSAGRSEWVHLDSSQLSSDAFPIFKECLVGDSIVFRVPADSAFKQHRPDFAKNKNGWLITTIRIKNIQMHREQVPDSMIQKEE